MQRRDFLRQLSLGLAGCWVLGRDFWPRPGSAAALPGPAWRLAFLSDAHLQDRDERRPEARALARAVAELSRLDPVPDLVLFGGDLAHNGDPGALALGREILAGLPSPLLMLMGEGDGPANAAAAWPRLFGEPWFSYVIPETGVLLGLHTAWRPGSGGPTFRVGASGHRWLARELARLDPAIPLLLITHAPLEPIFRPWQQWTVDGPEVLARLASFRQVFCLHGHVHNAAARAQCWVARNGTKSHHTLQHVSLPATAWPGPRAVQGTPAQLSPGLGPAGCGWLMLTAGANSLQSQPHIWQI